MKFSVCLEKERAAQQSFKKCNKIVQEFGGDSYLQNGFLQVSLNIGEVFITLVVCYMG